MKRRMMARRVRQERYPSPRTTLGALGALALIVVTLLAISRMFGATPLARPDASARSGVAIAPSAPPAARTRGPGAGAGAGVATPPGQPSPTRSPTASAEPTPGATPSRGAPSKPSEFDLERQAIDIAFPLRPETRYSYRDNFLEPRDGSPDDYNHARVNGDGDLLRLHDGIDIYGAEGEPVVAPLSGVVIDPGTRWEPWEPSRYGRTVVIRSTERETDGYVALLIHLDRVWVDIGAEVSRGQVVGTLGRTGNAEAQSVRTHLHFELRAPFLLDWSPTGEDRRVDAFNPYPSLVKADPDRT